MTIEINPVQTINGEYRPPSDKSLTHRAFMFGAIASEESIVTNPLRGEDCMATLACMHQLGMQYEWVTDRQIRMRPPRELVSPANPLDCGNSGTTIRLLSGIVASYPIGVTLTGDESLQRRPMRRVAEPLRMMGAGFTGDVPPVQIQGSALKGIEYRSPVASGQIKSCILLAGLRAEGRTTVHEPSLSRDHTERMLRATGVTIDTSNGVSIDGGQRPGGFEFDVPGDISSAAFMMVGAAILPKAELTIRDLSVNPSRTGILEVFDQADIPYRLCDEREALGEPVADLLVRRGIRLRPFEIAGDLVPKLIDEIPVLAVLATQCEGTTLVRDAAEMRVKESDRIETMAAGLKSMGARIEVHPDGFSITGPTRLRAARIEAGHDHRIAMAFAIAGLIADGTTLIDGAETIATSYPGFLDDLMRLSIL